MRAPTHTPTSKHVVTGITEQRCGSHGIRTPSRASICLDLCAARHMHTRTTLPHERDRNNCDIKSPALQCRRVTSFCGCAKRRGSKPQLSPDSSLHPQHGWRVPAAAPVDVATLRSMSYETEIPAARLRALARERKYSSRSERAPSTCTPVRMRTHPAGSTGIGGGANRGRVHSLHSRARHLRRASRCASGVRERFQAACVLSRIACRAFCVRRWVSSFHRAVDGEVGRAWKAMARRTSRCCFFDC
mgnify:CR=1 FL=1